MLSELEAAITQQLLPLEEQGYYVLNAPTDHKAVGRVGKKGEVRVAYQGSDYVRPVGLVVGRSFGRTLRFEVIVELQDSRLKTHPLATEVIEQVLTLLVGFVPSGRGCGVGMFPIRDGFVARNPETATWVYSVVLGLAGQFSKEKAA